MDLEVDVRNHVAFLTLNRPAALNALNFAMIGELARTVREAVHTPEVHAVLLRGAGGKAFCAGGDVRALYDSHRTGGTQHREFFVEEYRLDHCLHHLSKPFIALIDGITMGGGMGLAQASKLRLAGERTRIAMPEVGIGLIPDVGGSYFLSRLPGALGIYLALTGSEIRAGDALWAGLADLYLEPAAMARLEPALLEMRWGALPLADLERTLRSLATEPPAAPLAPLREAIDRHFSCATVPAILVSLEAETDPPLLAWAAEIRELLLRRSPTMLAVTLRALRLGAGLDLAECFRMEYTIVQHCFEQGDFLEGVRALIVDKDRRPRWRPARLEELDPAVIDWFFRDLAPGSPHPLADLGAD